MFFQRLSGWLDVSPTIRLGVALVVGVAAAVLIPANTVGVAMLSAWAIAGLLFALWTWLVILPMDAEATSEHALREEPSRTLSDVVVLLAAIASLGAVVEVLAGGGLSESPGRMAAVLGSVLVSWAVLHTTFALRYARMYYTEPVGGIDFHQQERPLYTDFAYVSATVGMSFAISDTDLNASRFRRTALVHALLAYLFGTVIVALLVNLVAGLVSS